MTFADFKSYKLPDASGVYFFIGQQKEILYIGKATSLKDRVRSYFSSDLLEARGPRLVVMREQAVSLKYEETDSVLEALILEANLIKKFQPTYNAREKDNKSFNYVVVTKEEYPRVVLVRGRELEHKYPKENIKELFGPFPQGGQLKEALKIIRKIFPFYDTKRPVTSYAQVREKKAIRFNQEIGVYPQEMSSKEYAKTVRNITLLFQGKKKMLIKKLEQDMKSAARKKAFEHANRIKKQIYALQHIQDITLIKDELKRPEGSSSFRIEAYDIAHTSGVEMVGVMTVVEDGEAKKSDYRKFKIKTLNGANDVAALREVLERRLGHLEWPLPKLIVMDGGKAQKSCAEKSLDEVGMSIKVVSVVKDDKHKAREILGFSKNDLATERDILLANAEAHRFALSWHRKRRKL